MADTPDIPTDLPLAPNGEVKAFDRLGNKVTVPKDRVGELYGMGGRVARRQEVAEAQTEEAYQKQGTLTKVATVASMAGPLGYPLHAYLRGQGAVLPPELEAYTQGVSQGMTGGLASVGMKGVVEAAGGQEAARAYAETAKRTAEAHAGLRTAGELAGFVGGAVAGSGSGALAKALPGAGISALGGVVEQAAAKQFAGVAARGALGRALATGGELAARGAVEGALYGGAQAVSEDMLGDREVAGDKVFAAMGMGALGGGVGGGVLGGAGSLAASGARGALGAARSGLGRALSKGEATAAQAAEAIENGAAKGAESATAKLGGLADDAGREATRAAEAVGVKTEKEIGALRKMLAGQGDDAARDAANSLAFDALGTTRKVADKINADVKGGTKAVGDYVNRRILKVASDDATLLSTIKGGRADDLLPIIVADKQAIGQEIGAVVKATPISVAEADLVARAGRIYKEMASDPTRIQGAKAFEAQVTQTFEAFRNGGKLAGEAGQGTMDLAEMYYQRAAMEGVAHEMRRGNIAAGDAMKGWLREVDAHLVDKLDDAAKAMGDTGARDKLMGLKREYQLASSAEKAATDGVNRIQGNNIFGIREGIGAAAGLAMGSPVGALATALGGKVLRERGSAAGAFLLHKMADMGAITRAMRAVDDQIGRASKGLLAAPAKRALPEAASTESVRTRAAKAMQRVAEIQASPERLADQVARTVEPMAGSAPELAGVLTQRMTSAAAFLAGKMPVKPDVDPFDPHPAPRLTDAQAATFMRYVDYTERPMRFFEELERGKITYEGAETIKALMPAAFAEVQTRTLEGLAELLARGQAPPYAQRERLGMLLDVATVPAQRPEHMQLLQSNVVGSVGGKPTTGAQPPKRPMPTKTQPSTLDRLEGK